MPYFENGFLGTKKATRNIRTILKIIACTAKYTVCFDCKVIIESGK